MDPIATTFERWSRCCRQGISSINRTPTTARACPFTNCMRSFGRCVLLSVGGLFFFLESYLCTSGPHKARQTRGPARYRGLQRPRLGQPPPKMVCNNRQQLHNDHSQQRMEVAAIPTSADITHPPPPRKVLFQPQAPLLLSSPMMRRKKRRPRRKLLTTVTKEEDR